MSARPDHIDPIVDAVAAYREGLVEFNAFSRREDVTDDDRDAYVQLSYGPPMTALKGWAASAVPLLGAIEAVRLLRDELIEESRPDGTPTLEKSLLDAALAFFDRRSVQPAGTSPSLHDTNQIEIEPGVAIGDLHDRVTLCAALARLEVDVLGIKAQLENPSDAQIADPSWRVRAEDALRWKKRGLAGIRYRLSQIREANRQINEAHQRAAAGDDSERELLRLAAEWRAACDACNADPQDAGADDPHIKRMEEIEAKAVTIRPATAKAFAAKLLLLSGYAGFSCAEWEEALLSDATALIGAGGPWPASRARPAPARERASA